MRFLLILTCLSSLFCISLSAADREPVIAQKPTSHSLTYLLKYKFKAGQKLYYSDSQTTTFITIKGDKREQTVQKAVYQKHLLVEDVSASNIYTIKPILDQVKMSAQFNDAEPVKYDSEIKIVPPKQFRGIDAAIGKTFWKLKVTPAGELLEQFDLRPSEDKPSALQQVNAEEINHSSKKNFFIVFPNIPIEVGQSWKERYIGQVKIPQSQRRLPVKFIRTYTLTAVKKNIASISVRTAQLTNISDPQLQVQLIQRTPSSKVQFDIEQGLMLSRITTVDEKVFAFAGANSVVKAESLRKENFIEQK